MQRENAVFGLLYSGITDNCIGKPVIVLRAVVHNGDSILNPSDCPLADFGITIRLPDADYDFCYADAEYDVSHVGSKEAARMAKLFAKLDRGLERLVTRFGRSEDSATQVARMADVLGLSFVARLSDEKDKRRSMYSDNDWRFDGIDLLTYILREDIRKSRVIAGQVAIA